MAEELPDKLYFKIGEVSRISGIKPFVLRYWETEFSGLSPERRGSKQRLYRKEDVELILRIKKMLYQDRFTIAGAKRKLAGKFAVLAKTENEGAEGEEKEGSLKANLHQKDLEIKNYQDLLKQINKDLLELKKALQARKK